MDRAGFADVNQPWWLLNRDLDYEQLEARRRLADALGYDRNGEWYLDRQNLEGLYDILEGQARDLLSDLDRADDEAKRKEWLEKVVVVVTPPEPAGTAPVSAGSIGSSAPAAPWTAATPAPVKRAGLFDKKKSGPQIGSQRQPAPDSPSDNTSLIASKVSETIETGLAAGNLGALAGELGTTRAELEELIGRLPDNFDELVRARAQEIASTQS